MLLISSTHEGGDGHSLWNSGHEFLFPLLIVWDFIACVCVEIICMLFSTLGSPKPTQGCRADDDDDDDHHHHHHLLLYVSSYIIDSETWL